MDATSYQTSVGFLPDTPSGLTPAHWSVIHLCNRCLDHIVTEQLIAHAQIHAAEQSDCEVFPSRGHSGTMEPKRLDRCEDPITASDDQHAPMTTDHRRR
jgi:hypothetical protein